MNCWRVWVRVGFAVIVLAALLPGRGASAAGSTTCNNGGAATIGDDVDCTVTSVGPVIPTTVVFSSTPVKTLILDGEAPTGAVTNTTDGEGVVTVSATVSSAAAFGVVGSGDLLSLTVNDGVTFTLGHTLAAATVTVGAGTSGVLNQSAGTITATTLAIAASGTFTQSGSGVINAATTIATSGTLTVVNQGTGTIQGAGSGQGALVFAGNYNTDAALGATSLASITVNDSVTLTLDQNAGATTFTVGTGTSGVVNQSAGTLTATTLVIAAGGTFTQSGSGVINAATTIATGGTLTVVNQGTGTIQGAGAGQGALVFAGDYNTDAALGGTSLASITVNSGFTLTLDQAAGATTFTASGAVAHSAGTLTATSLVIASGGVFTQSGGAITASTDINSGGTMNVSADFTHTGALSNSGTLNLAGNTATVSTTVTLVGGSTLKTTINTDAADDAGRITATGIATIAANTTIDITVTPGTLTVGRTYVIVSGGGGGSVVVPTTITDDNATYKFVGSTDGDSLTLTVQLAGGFSDAATTTNTSAVATALDAASGSGTADMTTVINTLNGLGTDAEKDTSMATMTPDAEGGMTMASRAAQNLGIGIVGTRIEAVRTGALSTERGMASGNPVRGIGVWLQGAFNQADQDPRKGASGFDTFTAGFAFGGDRIVDDGPWTVGVAYAYAITNVNFVGASSGDGTDINSYQGLVYGSYDGGAFFVDAIANVAFNSYDTNRKITVGSSFTRNADGAFDGWQYSVKATAGYPLTHGGFVLTPMASVQYTRLDLEGYTETGAGALNLTVADQEYDFVKIGLGLAADFDIETRAGTLSPTVRAMWLYDAVSDRQKTTSTFAGGGTSFDTRAPDAARHGVKLGAGVTYQMGENFSLAAAYDAEIRDRYLGHSGTLTLRFDF